MQCFFFLFSSFWKTKTIKGPPLFLGSTRPLLNPRPVMQRTGVCLTNNNKKTKQIRGWRSWGPSSIHKVWQQSLITINDDGQLVKDAQSLASGWIRKKPNELLLIFVFPSWTHVDGSGCYSHPCLQMTAPVSAIDSHRWRWKVCFFSWILGSSWSIAATATVEALRAETVQSGGGNWGGWRTEKGELDSWLASLHWPGVRVEI